VTGSPPGPWQTDRLDADATRLGLQVHSGSRTRPDGSVLRWRLAGVSEAFRSGALPFFITWHVPTGLHPAAMAVPNRIQPEAITHLELRGDPGDIDAWLGPHDLPVTTRAGASSLAAVNIRTRAGTITIS
jgi:Glyoxalase-like domain